MSRALLVLNTAEIRQKAMMWLTKAPLGTRVEFKGPKRTLDQNDRMWAMLTDIADQAEHNGRKHNTNYWKALFMDELGHEVEHAPSLYGERTVPISQSSSDLSKAEMSDMIELMFAWGSLNNIVFHDDKVAA